MNLDLFCYA